MAPWLDDLPLFNTESVSVPYQARSGSSQQGAKAVRRKAGSQAARVLALLEREPMTLQELATATGLPLSSICGRIGALRRDGQVRAAGAKKGPYNIINTTYERIR